MARVGNLLVIGVFGIGATVAAVVTATGQNIVAPPVLHEDLTPPADQVARTAARAAERASGSKQTMLGPEPTEGQNPQAISAGPKLLPEPSAGSGVGAGETVFGDKSFGADRETETKPDYATGADGTLHYVEVFNPSIVPFKRMTALDAVATDYTLRGDSSSTTEIPVGGKRRASRELFWGSLAIKLETGRDVAVPSVSPDMGVLSYEVEPKVALSFSKDRADNYYVRTDEPGIAGTFRLVFLADASPSYFSPRIPPSLRIRDLPAKLVRPMPESVRKVANIALGQLGLTRSMGVKVALDELVKWFRNFEAKEPPSQSGDIYMDLFTTQAGVCRHRSFAFMITANALGIPTRYVANEAHAWVEVYIPKQGWARIDLGGAALRLEVTGAEDKTMHGGGNDPFPKPPKYENNYTQLVGDIDGLTPAQIEERRSASAGGGGGAAGSGDGDGSTGDGDGAGDGDGDGDGNDFFDQSDEATGSDGRDGDGRLIGPGEGLPSIPEEELEGTTRTTIAVTSASTRGYRGEAVTVSGQLSAEGGDLSNFLVNIFLVAEDQRTDSIRIGYTTTRADGSFTAEVKLPTSLSLASYSIYAATPGRDDYAPSLSN